MMYWLSIHLFNMLFHIQTTQNYDTGAGADAFVTVDFSAGSSNSSDLCAGCYYVCQFQGRRVFFG